MRERRCRTNREYGSVERFLTRVTTDIAVNRRAVGACGYELRGRTAEMPGRTHDNLPV